MLATTYSIFQTVITFGVISLIEFALFYSMVLFATKQHVVELLKSFYKAFLEALLFVVIAMSLLLFLKIKVGFQDVSATLVLFEQMYALMLFLSLVLTCSMQYEAFAQNKYKYAFFGLICMLLFLLFYNF